MSSPAYTTTYPAPAAPVHRHAPKTVPTARADLLRPIAEEWDWQIAAACRGASAAVFFHPEGERGAARRRRVAEAKKICEQCPVLAQCREHALRVGEAYGTWGGMSESERRMLSFQR